ncbi:uncharacterized protein LOC110714378 [Chenopodium quinoa]|uniref:uncharacterized protein LOC110714378 n=1 Tax=Chenopodium quinoa TaxID=63459 RepID=UPI000B795E45|nr:uncharacterized protein LOC110714378 [Chenopodium quinoa]
MLSLENQDLDDEYDPKFSFSGTDNESSTDGDEIVDGDEDDGQTNNEADGIVVVDNYDPYADDVWEDDGVEDDGVEDDGDGNYFAKLYKNGEMFDKQEDEGCEWRLHASRLADGFTWAIKSIKNGGHTCLGLETRNPMVTSKWASRVLLEDIRANNDISGKALNALLWNRFNVQMATSTLYRVRARALIEIHGGYDDSYSFLPSYCEMIKKTNTGSNASCVWNPNTHVDRPLAFVTIFISFKQCLDGLKNGIRGFVGVDGTHLKGNYGGVLLSAVALDGNNELFPFAWGIVSNEDSDTWCFFVHHLRDLLRSTGRGDKWCIISDRKKGIEIALDKLWPELGRRYCTKHLASNWKKAFPGPLMLSLFWKACGACSEFTFKKAME